MGYSVATSVRGEGILLIEHDTLHLVRAPSTGRLLALRVRQGDRVEPGSVICEISQDELKDRILEAESRLIDLRRKTPSSLKLKRRSARTKSRQLPT